MNTFRKYMLYQIPGWIGVALIVTLAKNWFGFAAWMAWLLFLLYVAKDFLLYKYVKRAYEPKAGGPVELIGEKGVAVEAIAPNGYVKVRGELWKAEVARTEGPVLKGAPIQVQSVRGDTLIVVGAE